MASSFQATTDWESSYLALLERILVQGEDRPKERTGTGTRSLFSASLDIHLCDDPAEQGRLVFPAVTTKKLFFKSMSTELAWFLQGGHTLRYLHQHGVHIWDQWADQQGDLGPVYGAQWRDWQSRHGHFDQLEQLIDGLRKNPSGRRHLISAWNVGEIDQMALPPCPLLWQVYLRRRQDGLIGVQVQLYQRSADAFLGLPFNIANTALFATLIAQTLGGHYLAERIIWIGGDVHLYWNHFKQAHTQLERTPWPTPRLTLDAMAHVFNFEPDMASLVQYDHQGELRAPIAV